MWSTDLVRAGLAARLSVCCGADRDKVYSTYVDSTGTTLDAVTHDVGGGTWTARLH